MSEPLIHDELDVFMALVPCRNQSIIELGCGSARMARQLLLKEPSVTYVGMEVDRIQHDKNLAQPQAGMSFLYGAANAIPFDPATFDAAVMLKSLHHVPLNELDASLQEIARVLKPEGLLYVSEPVYAGDLNEIVKVFNDEGVVRAEAQRALDRALASGQWTLVAERRFDMPVRFESFEQFEQRMMRPTFKDHHLTADLIERTRAVFERYADASGLTSTRPMHVRCLRRT